MKLFFIFMLVTSSIAKADSGLPTLIRQPRMTAMGGAAVGLADDEYCLFNNPAGLAGIENRHFKVLGLGIEGSYDIYGTFGTSLSAFKNFSTSALNTLMGKDIYLRMSNVTLISLPHFELAYIVDGQAAIEQFNQANPTFQVGDMITHGIQAGTAWSFKSGKHPTDETRVGIAGKVLWRRGGYYTVGTTGFLQATQSGKSYIDNLVGGYGMGFGADLGVQYIKHLTKKTDISVGASYLDLGGTHFGDPHAETIVGNPSVGLGLKQDLNFFKVRVAADLKNLNQDVSMSNKLHLGTQLSIPLFDFYAGLNQMNPTYGLAFDLWLVRVTAVGYSEELGVYYHQQTSRRYMIQFDINLPI